MKLSILIPTVKERKEQFDNLKAYLQNLIDLEDLNEDVEILFLCDNKQITIGEKREWLYQMAHGLYSWQIDDDDSVSSDSLQLIIEAMESSPDCITFQEACVIDGVHSRSDFRLTYPDWMEDEFGFDHVRTPFFKTPIKTAICQQVPIPHIRFGEDHLWAQAIKPYLHTEVHINKQIYYYHHISTPHNQRYGITEE